MAGHQAWTGVKKIIEKSFFRLEVSNFRQTHTASIVNNILIKLVSFIFSLFICLHVNEDNLFPMQLEKITNLEG